MMDERRKVLLNYVYQKCQGTVQHGIFKGMKLLKKSKWGDGDLGGKLMGIYENELFPIIEQAIADEHDLIINYGCAEGVYGIGMAMKLPNSKIVMFDIDQDLLDIAKENAKLNNVNNVEFSSNCNNTEYFESLLSQAKNPFVIMDCEGYEDFMLNLESVPTLSRTSLIVEMHDFMKPGLTNNLVYKFNETHSLEGFTQGSKDYHIEPILELSDTDKLILLNENRPCTMNWVYMIPKTKDREPEDVTE